MGRAEADPPCNAALPYATPQVRLGNDANRCDGDGFSGQRFLQHVASFIQEPFGRIAIPLHRVAFSPCSEIGPAESPPVSEAIGGPDP
jgi:hypothetical protein